MTIKLQKGIAITLLSLSTCASYAQTSTTTSSNSTADKPNVLILMFDDMRFDTFSYRGGPVSTPNIDSLAHEGTRFDNAMTTTGLCSPSRAAMFTGRWGHKTGLEDNVGLYHSQVSELPINEGGLIKRASDAGYEVNYVGKWHLGPQGPALRGADYMWGHEHNNKRNARQWAPYVKEEVMARYNRGERDKNGEKHEYYKTLEGGYKDTHTYDNVKHGQEMIKMAAAKGKPFLGVISFEQPHPPYRVPEPYASKFDPNTVELPKNHLVERTNKPLAQDENWWPWHDVGHMTDLDWRKSRTFYYGAISMIDNAVGQLIETSKEAGIYDNLYIVVVGDQGSMLGEHGLYDKGPYAYDELMRMPLIIRDPYADHKTITKQVSMLDIAPTIAEWMDLAPDGDVDGRSLIPLIQKGDIADKGRVDKALYAYEWYNGGWFGIRAIRTPDMKFVWNPGDSRDELYDLVKDPVEINNEIKNPDYTPKLLKMIALMDEELVRTKDPSIEKFRQHMASYISGQNSDYVVD